MVGEEYMAKYWGVSTTKDWLCIIQLQCRRTTGRKDKKGCIWIGHPCISSEVHDKQGWKEEQRDDRQENYSKNKAKDKDKSSQQGEETNDQEVFKT